MQAEIYGSPNCAYCKQAMFLCETEGIEYDYFCMIKDFDKAIKASERAGVAFRSAPQVFIDGKHVGGFTDLEKFLNELKG